MPNHGITITETPTSVVPPVESLAALPVVVGTAPVHLLADEGASVINMPVLCSTYAEFVAAFGEVPAAQWDKFTLNSFAKCYFARYGVGPAVFVNVLDPDEHTAAVTNGSVTLVAGSAVIDVTGLVKSTLVVKTGQTTHVLNTDYTLAWNTDGKLVITRKGTGISSATATLTLEYDWFPTSPQVVAAADIIGTEADGVRTGLQLVHEVFPRFRMVPGLIACPIWSITPSVAVAMAAAAASVSGIFKALALVDIPTTTVTSYDAAPAWCTTNGYTNGRMLVCWPRFPNGTEFFQLSSHIAGVLAVADQAYGDVPYRSPSNRELAGTGAKLADGTEVWLTPAQANYLNDNGIITALNFIGGWRAWGNYTGAYPGVTDVKDTFIAVRRMFDWIANNLVLTFWQKIDYPVNLRLVDTIVDSANIWLNGLVAKGALLAGRVEFTRSENSDADLLNGALTFHVYLTPPIPAQEISFTLEYDVTALNALFA